MSEWFLICYQFSKSPFHPFYLEAVSFLIRDGCFKRELFIRYECINFKKKGLKIFRAGFRKNTNFLPNFFFATPNRTLTCRNNQETFESLGIDQFMSDGVWWWWQHGAYITSRVGRSEEFAYLHNDARRLVVKNPRHTCTIIKGKERNNSNILRGNVRVADDFSYVVVDYH